MKKLTAIFLLVGLLTFGISSLVLADGTETLGPPSISIASGTGIVAAGTGLAASQPGTIDVNVPGTVVQAILYWGGATVGVSPGDDTIEVDGNAIPGTLIGGPVYFFTCGADCGANQGDFYYSNYRADITGLGLVSSGLNSLTVDGMGFGGENSGAGLLVIFDDGSDTADIQVVDGLDLAYAGFPEPRKSTIPQTFSFPAAAVERTADLVIFAGSVGADGRSNTIKTITNGPNGATTDFFNLLSSADGDLWDTLTIQVTIPADAAEMTVEVISGGPDNNPASLNWVGAGLSIPPPPPGGEGCTPGGWAGGNGAFRWNVDNDPDWNPAYGNPFSHGTLFNDFFTEWGSLDGLTMHDLVRKGGGKDDARKAARSLVAAYLNASHDNVNYPVTTVELTNAWNDAVVGDIEFIDLHNQLDDFNNLGCQLD